MSNVSYKLMVKLACEKECPEAMWRVAVRFYYGIGVERDVRKARQLLWKAAKARNTFAMWLLAIKVTSGKWGFPVDHHRANYWYLQLFKKWVRDAAQGDKHAMFYMDMYQLEKIENPAIRKALG